MNKESAVTIYCTTDYDSFPPHPLQRPINSAYIKKLKNSILKSNLLSENPGAVDSSGLVIDGHHRLVAARELGIGWYYTKVNYGVKEQREVNAVSRKWSMRNYIDSYASGGNDTYIFFRGLLDTYDWLTATTLKKMVGITTPSIHSGSVELSADERAAIAEKAKMIDDIIGLSQVRLRRAAVGGLLVVMEMDGYSHKRMFSKVLAQPRSMVRCATVTQGVEMFLHIYNYKTGKRFRLSAP